MAEKFYSIGLTQDPYWYTYYKSLAHVTRSDEPLLSALDKFPYSYLLMKEAGDYFAEKEDPASKEKAVTYYETALKIIPTHEMLPMKKAKVLRQLKRHEEAVPLLRDWIQRYGKKGGLITTDYKSSLAKTYLEMGNPRLALEVVADEVASYKAGAMMIGAKTYEDLGQHEQAEGIYRKAVTRYPTVDHVLAGTAVFFWRHGRDDEAAEMISRGRKSMGKFSQWYFDDFLEIFGQASEDRVMEAVKSLNKHGATYWEISSLGLRFRHRNKPEIAYRIVQEARTQMSMENLEKCVNIYNILRKWKGEDEALKYLHHSVPQQMRGPLTMVLFKEGLFDLILAQLKDPKTYPPEHREFVWLQKLIAWLALDKKPADLERKMVSHYEENLFTKLTRRNQFDYYHATGRYLLGMISQEELLGSIKTPKQRCEFAYYIGLSERLKSNYPEAATWYHICRETLLQNNGEYHWASDELFWWAHMGTKNRHRLLNEDLESYYQKYASLRKE
jgi:tetratricopeptide (TPR) repeat protein